MSSSISRCYAVPSDVQILRVLVFAFAVACGTGASPHPLDLNTATTAELEALPGIGPRHAKSIIASRNARGGHFVSIDDLLKIDGIGPKTVDGIRALVEVRP